MGKAFLYKHFGGAKALFCSVNRQISGSAEGGDHARFFIGGGAMLRSLCRYVLEVGPPRSNHEYNQCHC